MHRKAIQGQNVSLWDLNINEIALYMVPGKTKGRFGWCFKKLREEEEQSGVGDMKKWMALTMCS